MAALFLQRVLQKNIQLVNSCTHKSLLSAVTNGSKRSFSLSLSPSFHSSPQHYSKTFYTETHEWIRVDDKVGTIGITDFAQEQLGDIAYCDLPDVGNSYEKGEIFATIESVKAASDLYMPVHAKILETNDVLTETPSLINESPFDKGWLVKVEFVDAKSDLDLLLDQEAYDKFKTSSEEH